MLSGCFVLGLYCALIDILHEFTKDAVHIVEFNHTLFKSTDIVLSIVIVAVQSTHCGN